jgi:hypothetical protein
MEAATSSRTTVESYLREMGVPNRYAEQMAFVPKEQMRWVSGEEFKADFEGFIPDLKDWVDARCSNLTDVELKFWNSVKSTPSHLLTVDQRAMTDKLMNKMRERSECERSEQIKLAYGAQRDYYTKSPPEPLQR